MAIAIASKASTTWTNGGTVTITKPTGLAEGDLMIAIIGGAPTVQTPSGWTAEIQPITTLKVFSKIASSGDAAASNFTFDTDGAVSEDYIAGIIYRITDFGSSVEILGSKHGSDTTGVSDTTISISGATVPTYSTDTLLFMVFLAFAAGSVENLSGYSVTGISNPTWTEDFDSTGSIDGDSQSMAIVSATVATDGTITAFQASTANEDNLTWNAILFSLTAQQDAAATAALLAPTPTFAAPESGGGTSATAALLSATPTINAPVSAVATPAVTNLDKNSSSWVNTPKS